MNKDFEALVKAATKPEKITYDPPKDEFYKERIKTLEMQLKECSGEVEQQADMVDELRKHISELVTENAKLKVFKAKIVDALIGE